MSHLRTLFSSKSFKAWVAGLCVVLSSYLVPIISKWLETATPETVMQWLGGYGVEVSYGLVATLLGLASVVWVYLTKNKKSA